MNITTKIKPLYDDLVRQHFLGFLEAHENDFNRLCNDLQITDEYTQAYNETVNTTSKNTSFLGISFFNYGDFLARLLNKLYEHKTDAFCSIVTVFLVQFLSSTQSIVSIDHIVLDLKSLGITEADLGKLSAAYTKYDQNYHLKVSVLKNHLLGRAANGGHDGNEYIQVRKSLLTKPVMKKLLPEFVLRYQNLDEFWTYIRDSISGYAPRRQYINEAFVPIFTFLEQTDNTVADRIIIDNAYVRDVWNKALERVNSDPEAAITTARTLIETVCKYVLDNTQTAYKDGAELPNLYKTTASVLNLSPDQHTEEIFKQILGGCLSVILGLGSVRNKISDAHAISQIRAKPSKRHGALAVNLSGAMSQFLLQTYEVRPQKG